MTTTGGSTLGLVSIVISNFNYARFLGDAVDSALGLDWPEVEVIVVDDGSTDASREVIARYGERITALFLGKSGQISVVNAGFAASRGELVIFLDADDVLCPSLVRRVASVWRAGVSKVQCQMQVIDAEGRPVGSVFPQYRVAPTPDEIRRWMTTSGDYPTPPGSGNAYARSFLTQVFPLIGFDQAADSHCVTAAPYLGDVLTIPEPLVKYRVHGKNLGAMSSLDGDRFNREVARAKARFLYAKGIAGTVGVDVPTRVFGRSLRLLPYRLASLRLSPSRHPIEEDSRPQLLLDALVSCTVPQGQSLQARAALLTWLTLVATLPLPLAKPLVLWRFVAASRPVGLRRWLERLRVVRAA